MFQLGEQKFLNVSRDADVSDDAWPKFDGRRGYQFARESDDVQVVIEVIAAAAMLRPAKRTRVTFPIMTDAADVASALVGEENVGTEIDVLGGALEAAAGACQPRKINGIIDRDKNIGVVRDRLCCGQRSHERYSHHPRTVACRLHKRARREKQMPARLGNRRRGRIESAAPHCGIIPNFRMGITHVRRYGARLSDA